MDQPGRRRLDLELRRLELHKQESAAKSVPYISFILTHVALVLFLLVSFFIDHLVNNPTTSLFIKIVLSAIAVLFLASEWAYAIRTSLRWKKNIIIFYELEREQRDAEEQERQRRQEDAMSIEQLKNRALQFDVQRLRAREYEQITNNPTVHSIRPIYPTTESWPQTPNYPM